MSPKSPTQFAPHTKGIEPYRELVGPKDWIARVNWSPDSKSISAAAKHGLFVWDVATARIRFHIPLSAYHVFAGVWSPDGRVIACAADDGYVRLYDSGDGGLIREFEVVPRRLRRSQADRNFEKPTDDIRGVSWSPDGSCLACGADGGVVIWDLRKGAAKGTLPGAARPISVLWSPNGEFIACSTYGPSVFVWDARALIVRYAFDGSRGPALAWSPDSRYLAFGRDRIISIFDIRREKMPHILEGHLRRVSGLSFSNEGKLLASREGTRGQRRQRTQTLLWSTESWEQVGQISEMSAWYLYTALAFAPTVPLLATTGHGDTVVHLWDVSQVSEARPKPQTFYKNAKVALVGDSGVGKSGLGLVLSGKGFTATESTHGRRIWSIESKRVKSSSGNSEIRELLLWDLAGQPGYRLIHQLHLEDVSLALILFDARSELDPFGGVRHWHRALSQAKKSKYSVTSTAEVLVAARVDRGPVGVSRTRVEAVMQELGVVDFVETSAKDGTGVERLSKVLKEAVDWNSVPTVTSNALFQKIKRYLLEEKQSGRVLVTMDELVRGFPRANGSTKKTVDNFRDVFSTCIGRLQALGLVRRFTFGDLVLLQPEILDAYASSIIFAAKDEPDGMGSIPEDAVRLCKFAMPEDERVKDPEKERLLLLATIEDLVRHEIALREPANDAQLLVFPSQLTRENPDLPDPAGKSSVFDFEGALANVYATLVVRLSHSGVFQKQDMWKNAVTFATKDSGKFGLFLSELDEGKGTITTFFDGQCGPETKFEFEGFILSHITQRAVPGSVLARRVFVCSDCHTAVSDAAITKRRERGFDWIDCNVCGERMSLVEAPQRTVGTVTAQIERSAVRRRELDTALISAAGEMHSAGFKKWAGGPIATIALVFTDVVGSTALGLAVGDEHMSEVRRAHFKQGKALLKAHDGFLIKTIGDSLMIAFRSAKDALDFTIKFKAEPGSSEIKIRGGIHVGPVQIEDEDAFGTMVNYAARVVSEGKGPDIFASDRAHSDIVQLGYKAHANVVWKEHIADLKGFTGPQTLWEAIVGLAA
jgi:WD40 repeat protein/class 3 adenylate cyclase